MKNKTIYIAGHNGLVGSSIYKKASQLNFKEIFTFRRSELDLTNQNDVYNCLKTIKPDFVIIAAAKVGGINANNNFPADFIYENLMIQNNIIHSAYHAKVEKLLFLGSSCIYPKFAPQPIKETELLNGYLEKTNEAYAIAKIAGIKMCEYYRKQYGCNFISAMPTNIYGPGDNFNDLNSHVVPALINRIHKSKINKKDVVTVWGSGKPLREFLFVEDLAEACLFILKKYNDKDTINIGSGEEISIKNLTRILCKLINYNGEIIFDSTKPDGTKRKSLDISKIIKLGWKPNFSLKDGLSKTYKWYLQNLSSLRE